MARRRFAGIAASAIVLPLLYVVAQPATASAAPGPEVAPTAAVPASDIRELTRKDFTFNGKPIETATRYQGRAQARGQATAAAETPPVGTVRQWMALDDYQGIIYLKPFTLRGVGDNIEVWVANDTEFPEGDCRRQIPNTTTVTDQQVAHLINEFDTNMYPKSVAAFSTPPERDGSNAIFPGTSPAPATARSRWSTTYATTTSTSSRRSRATSPGSTSRTSTRCSTATS